MSISQEMFRFVTTRRAERVIMSRIASRLIRDRRPTTRSSLLVQLYGAGEYEAKLRTANSFAAAADFLASDDSLVVALDPMVAFFRDRLAPEIVLADLGAEFQAAFPRFARLLEVAPPRQLVESTNVLTGRLWDSLYAQTIRGCDRYTSTNHLVDGLRVYHVLRLLWLSAKLKLKNWAGGGFDDYHTLIDLNAALAVDRSDNAPDPQPGPIDPKPQPMDPHTLPPNYGVVYATTEQMAQIDAASRQMSSLVQAGAVRTVKNKRGQDETFFQPEAVRFLSPQPAFKAVKLETTPLAEVARKLRLDRTLAALEQEKALAALVDPGAERAYRAMAGNAVAVQSPTAAEALPPSLSALAAPGGVFRVPLTVGAIKPPIVGDLLIVEQTLRRYELGELADIESIMRGERRERTIRKLARTSQTTTTETAYEQEQSSSLKTDERFQLASQAQQAAEQSFGVQTGVSATGKFGPVQVSASVNASFDTSKSSSESTSQEYAKTVTEEATQRIMSSIKESSSITILTETQDTTLRGFNNEKGAGHVNGLYRWVDKIYDAQLVNYGRRLMFGLNVPEPAAFYRALLAQNEDEVMADLEEPLHPSQINAVTVKPLRGNNPGDGFQSYQDIDEKNYAALAAYYDISVQPPPAASLTGSTAFAYPSAMEAKKMDPHDQVNDLSYVTSDNTITLDPSYRLTHISVHAPSGASGDLGSYVDALQLGEVAGPSTQSDGTTVKEANLILVQVANKSFYLSVRRDPDDPDDKKIIKTNFNSWEAIEDGWPSADRENAPFSHLVQSTIPVTITAFFEGMFTLTAMYKATRTDEAYDAWKSATYAAILKGYTSKKQAYDQALALAQSKAQSATEAKTFSLRDDQYRSIELTELKRGCIDLLTQGTAAGYTSLAFKRDGAPRIVYDPTEGATLPDPWRTPLANGAVAEFFEQAFEWENTTYQFYPYYWAGAERWQELAQASGADPVFEQFLRAGNASVVVPVRPGYERPVIFFLKTGLIWGGGYLSLFTAPDMLDVYADVELGRQFDPPLPIGDAWEIRLPTSMVMLQEDSTLPEFPPEPAPEAPARTQEPVLDDSVPF